MQKRKAMASKKKGNGNEFEVEIAGADQVRDLLNESQDLPDSDEKQI